MQLVTKKPRPKSGILTNRSFRERTLTGNSRIKTAG
jgi:hypothetical protein